MANAWHHRMDSLSAGVALVGVSGQLAGIAFLDPLGGIVDALILFYNIAGQGPPVFEWFLVPLDEEDLKFSFIKAKNYAIN